MARSVLVSGTLASASGALLLWSALSSPALAGVPISVTTTDCGGDVGMASFDVERLYKIQADDCADPTDPGRKLQQVLLKSDGRLTRYEVLSVTQAEAASILEKVNAISRAELESLTRPDVVVERTETTRVVREERTSPTRGDTGAVPAAPPAIELIDPPVASTRSITRVMMSPDAERRLIVGRASAEAGILSLTVNGSSQLLDGQGLFKAEVATHDRRTPVTIVAVDGGGGSSTVTFDLIREEPADTEPAAGDEVFGRYHALVVANNEYQHLDDLATPENDGTVIARILRERYGFEVTTLYDATRYDILSGLNDMRRQLTENDNLLIYFAGHGAYDKANNRGHWLPVDAEQDSTANWVSTVDITDLVNGMSARHVLVVADSCYSGALSRSAQTDLDPGMSEDLRLRWLQAIARTRSRHVLTSGGLKPVPDDGGNGHSIFANALIEVLGHGEGVIESSAIFREVKRRVEDRAEALQVDQTPNYAQLKLTGHEYGEFVLVTRTR